MEYPLHGGKAEKAGALPSDFDPEEIKMGLKVETEHSDDPKITLAITLDHLTENPKYYTILKNAGLADELDESAKPDYDSRLEMGCGSVGEVDTVEELRKLCSTMDSNESLDPNSIMTFEQFAAAL